MFPSSIQHPVFHDEYWKNTGDQVCQYSDDVLSIEEEAHRLGGYAYAVGIADIQSPIQFYGHTIDNVDADQVDNIDNCSHCDDDVEDVALPSDFGDAQKEEEYRKSEADDADVDKYSIRIH